MQPRDLVAFDLKAARKTRNLSQLQTAEMLCTTQPTISRWEAEGTTPAIVRKAWEQHWQLEDLKNDVHTSVGKDRMQGVSKGDTSAENDGAGNAGGTPAQSDKRAKRTSRGRRKVSGGTETSSRKDARAV